MTDVCFGDAAGKFANQGKLPASDLLPLIPPNGKISSKSNIQPFQLGKIPGRYKGNEWYGLTGTWPVTGLSERDQKLSADWPTENVGLRAAEWPAVDCDINDPVVMAWVARLVKTHLGFAPCRIRGNSPRSLYVFRRIGEDAVRKMQVIFTDRTGAEHKVEVLGQGQQYVVSGMHPSGAAYEWQADAHLVDVTADGLGRVTEAQLRQFMETLAKEIVAKGGNVTRLALASRGAGAQGQGASVDELDPIAEKSLVLDALHSFRNDQQTLPSREQFVSITAAYKAALGREAEQGFEAFNAWATQDGWAYDEYVKTVWDSLQYVRTGVEPLFRQARKAGWHGDAVLDFADSADDVDRKIEEFQDQLSEEDQAIKSLADKLCYYAEQQRWIVRGTREQLSHDALNRYPGLGTTIAKAGATGAKTAANILINSGLVTQVSGITYLPGRDPLVTWIADGRGGLFFNRWFDNLEPLPDTVTDAEVKPWLDHLEYLFPEQKDRDILIAWMAHSVQRRGEKVRWAPIIIGEQGVGKDVMIKPVVKYLAHNYSEVSPDRLFGQFNDFVEREMIVVQEMVRFEKVAAYEKLKALIAGTASDMVIVERKYQASYLVPNTTNFLFFSNHLDAIKIDAGDRRFFVVHTEALPKGMAYYDMLIDDFYVRQGGWRKVVRWLKQYDLSQFNANTCPEATYAKYEMYEQQLGFFPTWLEEQFAPGGYWADRTVITSKHIYSAVQQDFNLNISAAQRRDVRNASHVTKALRHCGWHHHKQLVRLPGTSYPQQFWVRSTQQLSSDATDLRVVFDTESNPSNQARKDFGDE